MCVFFQWVAVKLGKFYKFGAVCAFTQGKEFFYLGSAYHTPYWHESICVITFLLLYSWCPYTLYPHFYHSLIFLTVCPLYPAIFPLICSTSTNRKCLYPVISLVSIFLYICVLSACTTAIHSGICTVFRIQQIHKLYWVHSHKSLPQNMHHNRCIST